MDKNRRIGHYVSTICGSEEVKAYVPSPLSDDLNLNIENLQPLLEEARDALGHLRGIGFVLPDINYFLYSYIRKEAVLSSQIEGTQSSMSDLMSYEAGNFKAPLDDVQEVSSYVSAMNYALKTLDAPEGLPLCLRLLCDIHKRLMNNTRGSNKDPGEFRKSQNWIGGTRPGNALFVPPPVVEMHECLSDLEKFLHKETKDSILIKIALAHVQFETIHPFLDGNGRLGRLLITLMLCNDKILDDPILYLSLYFKIHRDEYYDRLQNVRKKGDWEGWIAFFLEAVIYCAKEASQNAKQIVDLFSTDKEKIISYKKSSGSILRVFEHVNSRPITKSAFVEEALGISKPAALRNLRVLVKLAILEEHRGKGSFFIYREYLDILNKDTEL